ncbi:CDP-diacylglycerol--glycerol-3-phosphate 3-phosphatidyltransferase [bacterium TMED181]|nr:CDP-diacylglycerol--glycerol-3-phosphate 3-phosphatidyltransferase [Planctomycetota bacterium]OUW45035.1 MAG: CDP-diacylglycerol--glycerol-3-phosphate 3-phosphatidyltransferase [bacterium TMED181]
MNSPATKPSGDWKNLPNLITISRLGIAVLLFAMLTLELQGWGIGDRHLALNIATVAFILCVATDAIDGYLARKWKMVTAFGRLADTFVDKIVICGTLIYLVKFAPDLIKPWFVVIIVTREFLVSGLKSYYESQGQEIAASIGGKLKMILQSILIPAVMLVEGNRDFVSGADVNSLWKTIFSLLESLTVILFWGTLVTTLWSGLDYLLAGFRNNKKPDAVA